MSKALADGSVSSGLGSALIVNDEGWIVTAAHIVQDILAIHTHKQEMADHQSRCKLIESNSGISTKARRKQIGALPKNPGWILDQAVLWGGHPRSTIANFQFDPLADIAIGKLEPFDPQSVSCYPVLKNPVEGMATGTSLCRLGFPFHNIQATYNPGTKQFLLAPDVLPVPMFPKRWHIHPQCR